MTYFTTKQLKLILELEKSLTFFMPGRIFNNWTTNKNKTYRIHDPIPKKEKKIPLDLTITVFNPKGPANNVLILVNGINQRLLPLESDLHKAWFKHIPSNTPGKNFNYTANKPFKDFNEDLRFLLRLNIPEIDPNLNVLCKYIKNEERLNKYIPNGLGIKLKHPKKNKPYVSKKSKHTIVIHPEPLVCIKDLVTKEVIRLPKSEASKLVEGKEHLKYCKKREWKHYINSLNPKPKIEEKVSDYWIKDTREESGGESSNYYIPKIVVSKPKLKVKFVKTDIKRKSIGKACINMIENKSYNPKKRRLYDRHKRYITTVIPPIVDEDKLVYKEHKTSNKKVLKRKNKATGEIIEKPNKHYNKQYVDFKLSPVKMEKYSTTFYVPIYEYIPLTFSSKKFPEVTELVDTEGYILMKRIFKGLEEKTVTFMRPSRTTYKTIVTTQYPGSLGYKRHVIKRNYEELKKQREEELKQQKETEKTENKPE